MLNPITTYTSALNQPGFSPARIDRPLRPDTTAKTNEVSGAHQFGSLFTKLVDEVETTRQGAAAATEKVMLGQSDQLHNAVISLQESSVALGLMVEVRNKLVESYQELMRMPV
jgi:flagellar hook-basal body complex protein FliE